MKLLITSRCIIDYKATIYDLCARSAPRVITSAVNELQMQNIKNLIIQAMQAVGMCCDQEKRMWYKFLDEPEYTMLCGKDFDNRVNAIAEKFINRNTCTLCIAPIENSKNVDMFTLEGV